MNDAAVTAGSPTPLPCMEEVEGTVEPYGNHPLKRYAES